ncbi:MAG: hypothetical protein A3B70_05290 [Deltaproteobacteria bacterium RIFCSPHIGHO2_02_FULL_40_11]|nr:MAG: hypothetical protein A3B70_05290 [Deltaproteobacteria bacterium RIFCSPHIGHO2_02_FULL_40_11]
MTKLKKTLVWGLTFLFFFTISGTSYPKVAWADPYTPDPETSLFDQIFLLAERIELESLAAQVYLEQNLYQDFESQNPTSPSKPKEGQYCHTCHETPDEADLKPSANLQELLGLDKDQPIPDFMPIDLQTPAEKKIKALPGFMMDMKVAVEKLFREKNITPDLMAEILKSYLVALSHFMVTRLLQKPLDNPLETLDFQYGLELPFQKALTLRKYLYAPIDFLEAKDEQSKNLLMLSQKEKNILLSSILIVQNKVYFSDGFKINLEMTQLAKETHEEAWTKLLKLQTISYLSQQLFQISNFWTVGETLNERFFHETLGANFRSIGKNFGAVMHETKLQNEMTYNLFLANHIKKQDIPNILTVKTYQSIMAHAPLMLRLYETDEAQTTYIQELNRTIGFFENETKITPKEIYHAIYHSGETLKDLSTEAQAVTVRNIILEQKSVYLHKHLLEFFVLEDEFSFETAEKVKYELLEAYKKNFPLSMLQTWLSRFKAPAADYRMAEFVLGSVAHATETLQEIDEKIQILLLHKLNQGLSRARVVAQRNNSGWNYGRAHYQMTPLKYIWANCGMNDEKCTLQQPISPEEFKKNEGFYTSPWNPQQEPNPTLLSDILPMENIPELPSVEFNEVNFKILMAMVLSQFGQDLYLTHQIKNISELTTKAEMKTAFQTLENELQEKVDHPSEWMNETHEVTEMAGFGGMGDVFVEYETTVQRPTERALHAQHEIEKLKASLDTLKTIHTKIQSLEPQNETTLNDYFKTPDERLAFFKTKKDTFLNMSRILSIDVPIHSGNMNQDAIQEKTLYQHIQSLMSQDGLVSEDVSKFLQKNQVQMVHFNLERDNHSFPVPNLKIEDDYNYAEYNVRYRTMMDEFMGHLSRDERDEAERLNRYYLYELRDLEKKVLHSTLPHSAYFHPEYFIGTTHAGVPSQDIALLKEIQEIRQKRKEVFLDKGGATVETHAKEYLLNIMVRHALIEKDLKIRKSIYNVVQAKDIEDLKEYIFDPFIMGQAFDMVRSENPNQLWRLQNFESIHKELIEKYGSTIVDRVFHSTGHSIFVGVMLGAWLLLTLTGIGAVPAYFIGLILLADFGVQLGFEFYEAFWVLPEKLEHKKDFYHSTVLGGQEGPSSLEELQYLQSNLTFKKWWAVGSSALLFLPWARMEWRNSKMFFHKSSKFIRFKLPRYARYLGLEKVEGLTMTQVEKQVAFKMGISAEELSGLSKLKDFVKRAKSAGKLKKYEAQNLFYIYRFFKHPGVAIQITKMTLTKVEHTLRILNVTPTRVGVTLAEIESSTQRLLRENARLRGQPAQSQQFIQELLEQKIQIENAFQWIQQNAHLLPK